MDEHIARVLKMLEEGKISAEQAEKLISAISKETAQGASSTSTSSKPQETRSESTTSTTSTQQDSGRAKSFEFQWSQKKGFPFDLSGLGKQISDAVKKLDPEKFVRDARTGFAKGGRKLNFRGFSWFNDSDEGRPENTMGLPTARESETLNFDLAPGGTIQAENNFGAITVFGGGDKVTLEYDKEAWASLEEDARKMLGDVRIEASVHTPESGPGRLEVSVIAPDLWRDGTVNVRLHVPEEISLKLATVYGEIRAENTSGAVEIQSISGGVALDNLKGDVRAEGISGEMTAANISGPLSLTTKSGDLTARGLSRGGTIVGVSGDVRIKDVEGGRIEARSVSGDVHIERAGLQSPVDVRAESISGDLVLSDARGNISLKTVSGDVDAGKLDALTLQGESISGDVRIGVDTPLSGTLTTNTVSGDVTITVPGLSNFRFTLATLSGELDCEHTVTDSKKSDTMWTGTIGTGAGTVNVHTRSGDVRLKRGGSED